MRYAKLEVETIVPQSAADVSIRRCRPMIQAALLQSQTGQNFFNILTSSCYLQGVWDIAEVLYNRKSCEGEYEECR